MDDEIKALLNDIATKNLDVLTADGLSVTESESKELFRESVTAVEKLLEIQRATNANRIDELRLMNEESEKKSKLRLEELRLQNEATKLKLEELRIENEKLEHQNKMALEEQKMETEKALAKQRMDFEERKLISENDRAAQELDEKRKSRKTGLISGLLSAAAAGAGMLVLELIKEDHDSRQIDKAFEFESENAVTSNTGRNILSRFFRRK